MYERSVLCSVREQANHVCDGCRDENNKRGRIYAQHEADNEEYYKWWYTDEGEIRNDCNIMADSFYEFFSVDIDGDYVYEIKCRQYVSLFSHSDFIGWAVTVLKYNNELSCFEIVEASFEPRK